MSLNALESEDLLNVRLVRMEYVQPSRKIIENCVVNTLVYNNEYIVKDEDSNIGSMVSIQSEDIADSESDAELIVPDILDPLYRSSIVTKEKKSYLKAVPADNWPTLEILPGGVIKNADKIAGDSLFSKYDSSDDQTKMMYACAKCSQSFRFLFSLVKHVKCHKEPIKKQKEKILTKQKTVPVKEAQVGQQPKRKKVLMSKSTINKVPVGNNNV